VDRAGATVSLKPGLVVEMTELEVIGFSLLSGVVAIADLDAFAFAAATDDGDPDSPVAA
jgi:hypothetical protein